MLGKLWWIGVIVFTLVWNIGVIYIFKGVKSIMKCVVESVLEAYNGESYLEVRLGLFEEGIVSSKYEE